MTRSKRTSAVRRLGQDVCLLAGDGADRWGAILGRFEWRIERGASPREILVLASTERAAAQLRLRLAERLTEPAPVYSIPAFCEWLLGEHAVEADLDPGFEVMEAADAQAELFQAAGEALDGWLEEDPEAVTAMLAALDLSDPPRELAAVLETMRLSAPEVRPGVSEPAAGTLSELVRTLRRFLPERPRDWSHVQKQALAGLQSWGARMLELAAAPPSVQHFRLLAEFHPDLHELPQGDPVAETAREIKRVLVPAAREALTAEYFAPQRALLFEALERIDRRNRERLDARNAFDPAGLVEKAVDLLRTNAEVRCRVSERFVELLVEGLENLNPLEAALIDLLRPRRGVFAAGDPNEAVDGFPLAGPEAFRRFRDSLRAQGRRVGAWRKDHRSRNEILWAREAILAGARGVEPRTIESARRFAPMAEPCIEVMAAVAGDAEAAAELEARLVAQRIVELEGALEVQDSPGHTRPARLSDMAVLAAGAGALEPIERALDCAGVARLGAQEALAASELARLLRVIRNPRDEISLAATLRSRFVGVSQETLLTLKQYGNLGIALGWLENVDRALLEPQDFERLRAFRDRLRQWRGWAGDAERLAASLVAAGYSARTLARVRDTATGEKLTLTRLIGRLERLRAREADRAPERGSEAVTLLTMRSARGRLAFPVVFVVGLGEGQETEPPAVGYSPSAGLTARWLDPATSQPARDAAYSAFHEEWRRARAERDARLLWLTLGLAEERLVLSFGAPAGAPRHWAARIAATFQWDVAPATNRPVPREVAVGSPKRKLLVRALSADRVEKVERAVAPAPAARQEALGRPAPAAQHDALVSVAAVSLFEECPRKYYLEEYVGWQRPARTIFRQPEGGSRGARAASISALDGKLGPVSHVGRDVDFLLELEGVVLEGRIDLWFEREGRLTVAGINAGEMSAEEAAERALEYSLPLRLQALALERLAGRMPNEAFVHFTAASTVVPVGLDPSSLASARESVRALVRAQSAIQFPLKSGERCRACPFYRGACPAE